MQSSVIIITVFDPNAHLKRFFGEGTKEEYLFLVDEAHNLVERGREMYSAVLYKEEILEVQKLVRLEAAKLAKALRECNKQFLELKRECENYRVQTSVSHIALKLMNVLTELEDYLEKNEEERRFTRKFWISFSKFEIFFLPIY